MGVPWFGIIGWITLIIGVFLIITSQKGINDADYQDIYQNAYAKAAKACQERRLTFEALQPTSHTTFKAICVTTSPYRRIEIDV